MIKQTLKYKKWTIEVHVGGVKAMYIAFDEFGNKVLASYNLTWLKKDLTALLES